MLARQYELPCFGGSDSHREDCVGLGYTILQEDITCETDLINYILSGKPTMVGGQHYEYTAKAKLGKINNVLVYSFWFYNKGLALLRRRARKLELQESAFMNSFRADHSRLRFPRVLSVNGDKS